MPLHDGKLKNNTVLKLTDVQYSKQDVSTGKPLAVITNFEVVEVRANALRKGGCLLGNTNGDTCHPLALKACLFFNDIDYFWSDRPFEQPAPRLCFPQLTPPLSNCVGAEAQVEHIRLTPRVESDCVSNT